MKSFLKLPLTFLLSVLLPSTLGWLISVFAWERYWLFIAPYENIVLPLTIILLLMIGLIPLILLKDLSLKK